MKVVIIGAGMGGLCAGIGLKRLGHEVHIYEQADEIRPVGAALSLWSNGVKCLNFLGLGKEVQALGGAMDSMAYIDGISGQTMTRFSLQPLVDEVGQKPYPVSRADLQAMLMDAFGRDRIHLGMKMTGIAVEGQKVRAVFAGGTEVAGDLLIGADGAHSAVRAHVVGAVLERRYAGYVNWNGLVPIDESIAPANQWTTFVGQGKRASVMPVADGRFYFFFDVPLPPGGCNDRSLYQSELRRHFDAWAPPVLKLIDRIDAERTNRVEIHDIDPIETWVRGPVVLLGDAAHNMTPDIGQGGCCAMEDAVTLTLVLQSHTQGLDDALRRYEQRRAGRAKELVLRARKRAGETHAIDPETTRRWYEELRAESGERILKGLGATISGGPLG